ncbi:DUF5682 family protein [Streptomyces coelicoflavus]|uniref:DUF5682 family protein n=1 Tax=Streptomyces coelicoflavus TaxID=285562 RepID=UPI00210CCD66|nr:DUF5682 family protein [Streptomyces coelicoflavus]MCQ4203329.1 DUF5682 family protein [Streptomyces coelicoflavus]
MAGTDRAGAGRPSGASGGPDGTGAPGGRPLLLGVRHHGPGSARAVRAALDAARPGVVLVEGPPEADALIPLAAREDMRPPVALLAHAVDELGRSAFWPMAEFSPEWVALRWALEHDVPARFIDLPAAHTLALRAADEEAEGQGDGRNTRDEPGTASPDVRGDPLAALAAAAGHDDPERWWEDVIEHRGAGQGDVFAPFTSVEEAMAALRETEADGEEGGAYDRDLVREAHMRLQVRAARREFARGVAVVCGAWHVPALRRKAAVTADRALLKGLPRTKVDMTWVPWTHRRLSRAGGYGAGIESPGWYGHLFAAADRPVERWLTRVAGLLREEDRVVSPAHVIEAARLADALAVLRGRPLPGLSETTDAVRAVLCDGSDVPLALVHDRLVVGDVLGEVPAGAPAVPLQRDLTRSQRRLRLKPEAAERELELDLRKETDAARSRLLHRLRLLGVGWGEPVASRSTGTFRETWRLRWEPELSVRVAEAGVWGTTVLSAATARAEADALTARGLAEVTALAERCLLAELPDALAPVMRILADRAALDTDVGHLAEALPALVRALRYGDVRGTDTGALAEVAAGLAERVFVGLPAACAALDTDAAVEMRRHVDAVHTAVGLLGDAPTPRHGDLRPRWRAVLRTLSARDTVPGVVRGRAIRLLLDDGELAPDEAGRLMGLALSPGTPPADAAAWIEGFVGGGSGGGMLLLHDERLLALIDAWLTGVPADAFTNVLPLLRRTFSAYEPGVRRSLGELVGRGPRARGSVTAAGSGIPGFAAGLDTARADAVLPVVRLLLGRDPAGHAGGDGPAGGDEPARGDHSVRDDDLVVDGEPARDDDLVRHGELVRDDDLVGVET